MIVIVSWLLFLFILVSSDGGAWGSHAMLTVDEIAARVVQAGMVRGKRIAIANLSHPGWRPTQLEERLSGQLEMSLIDRAREGGFEILTRGETCRVIRENKLWHWDQFDPAIHKKLAGFGQVDLVAASRVMQDGARLSVTIRETETGKIVWEESSSLVLDEEMKILFSKPMAGDGCGERGHPGGGVPSADAPLRVRVWTDKQSYRIGQPIRFGIRVNRDAYITLINIGTSGKVTVVYPNRLAPNHFVRAGQDIIVPPRDASVIPVVSGPEGFDQIRVIASEEPYDFHPADTPRRGSVFRSLDPMELRGLAVEIAKRRSTVTPGKWAEEVIAVRVVR